MWHWINPFRQLSAGDVMRQQLLDAQRARAEHAALREYHAAMEAMLKVRCERITAEFEGQR